MPAPSSMIAMATLPRSVVDPDRDRRPRRAGVDGIVEEVAERLFERVGVGDDPRAGVAEQANLVSQAVGGDGRGEGRREARSAGR